jgi:hypothetical protein
LTGTSSPNDGTDVIVAQGFSLHLFETGSVWARGYELPFGPMIPFNDTLIEVKKVGA